MIASEFITVEDIPEDNEHKKVFFKCKVPLDLPPDCQIYLEFDHEESTEKNLLTPTTQPGIYELTLILPSKLLATYSLILKQNGEEVTKLVDENNPQRFHHPQINLTNVSTVLALPGALAVPELSDKVMGRLIEDTLDLSQTDFKITIDFNENNIERKVHSGSQSEFWTFVNEWKEDPDHEKSVLFLKDENGDWGIFTKNFAWRIDPQQMLSLVTELNSNQDLDLQILKTSIKEIEKQINIFPFQIYLPTEESGSLKPNLLLLQLDGRAYLDIQTTALIDKIIIESQLSLVTVYLSPFTDRMKLYACNDRFTHYLAKEFIPRIRAQYHCSSKAEDTYISGSSMGGLAATYAGLTHPEVFGNVISQSGAFWSNQKEVEEALTHFVESKGKTNFVLDAGICEIGMDEGMSISLRDSNRELVQKMCIAGLTSQLDYIEFNGGHSFLCWQATWQDRINSAVAKSKPLTMNSSNPCDIHPTTNFKQRVQEIQTEEASDKIQVVFKK